MASPLVYIILVVVVLCFTDAAQNFNKVSVCPRNAATWEIESNKKNCQGDTPDYLCAAIENMVGHFGEICTKYGLSPARKCAVLNNQTHNLDSVDCKATSGCPENPYNPSELWKYPICYADFYGTTRAPPITTVQSTAPPATGNETQERPKESSGSGAGVAAGVVVVLLIIMVVVLFVVFYIRNQFGFKDKVQQLINNIRNRPQGSRGEGTSSSDKIQGKLGQDEENGKTDELEKLLIKADEDPVNDTEKKKQVDKATYATVIKDSHTSKKKEKGKKDMTVGDSDEHQRSEEEKMEMKVRKLNILLKYLVHILKREIDVKDLKEKSIIHSKSLREHFTQPVLQDLYSIEKAEDYGKLDVSLVFALLRNFCVSIKSPTRGWDYEPPDDERKVGADIERIRSMWNKYCDNNYEFKNLDDVLEKMKETYGTVAVQGDQDLQNETAGEKEVFSELKEKIQSIKLNPDCSVEKGIVITEAIRSAVQSLETGSVVICKGAIGCGKTHALKAIQNTYKEKGWKVRWMEECLFPQEENLEDKTIVICDNLFGSYGCNTFSSNGISKAETLLEKFPEKSSDIKLAVGIHQHVFDEVKKTAQLKILQNKNITIDLDKPTKSEMLLILKEQHKEGHCKTDPNCWFKDVDLTYVIDKLSQNQGHIGSPFLSLMYCYQHDLFSEEYFTRAPIQSLTQRFQKMRNDSTDYYCLVYLMCVGKHNSGDELTSWAGELEANLTVEALQNIAIKMPGFIRVENGVETLRHEILTIALFKATAGVEEVFLPVVQRCEIEILLQLMRPDESCNTEFSCVFASPKKKSQFRNIGKHIVKRFADTFKSNLESIKHPLKNNAFFEEKFDHYLTSEPKVKHPKL